MRIAHWTDCALDLRIGRIAHIAMVLNAFVVLNVTVAEDMHKAYRRMALLHHPDKGGDAEKFLEVAQAYEMVADDEKKQRHLLATCPAQPGQVVRLHRLCQQPHLNDMRGTAGAWNGQRLVVEIVGYGKIYVKPENIAKEAPGRAQASATAQAWVSSVSASTGWNTWACAHASASTGTCPSASASAHESASAGWSSASAAANGDAAQDGEVMKEFPGGCGMWPYCQLCWKWSGPDHRNSKKHKNKLAWKTWKHCEHCPPPPPPTEEGEATAPPPTAPLQPKLPKPSPPLPTDAWTTSEQQAVRRLLEVDRTAFDMQDSPGGIYAVGANELFSDWSEDELRTNARILQLGLMEWQRRSQKIQELLEEARTGKACMEAPIQAFDWTARTPTIEPYYVKTAGDMLQSYWVWQHRLDSRYHFCFNACQAAFSKWIYLSHCIGIIEEWNEHATADLCEAVTLCLPVRLANHYLTCLANYYKLKWSHLDVPRCQHASEKPCFKVVETGECFCRKHGFEFEPVE